MGMLNPNQTYAVWDGRFQPFHLGHLAVIHQILDFFQLPLALMVIQSSIEPPANDYVAQVNIHHAPERNPLTLWERQEMISKVLQQEEISGQVTLLGIPRPDLYWNIARSFYPAKRFMCLTEKDSYEKSKAIFWSSLGEETRLLPTSGLSDISATRVKELIKSNGGWKELIHPCIVDYFEEIKGPARFQAAQL